MKFWQNIIIIFTLIICISILDRVTKKEDNSNCTIIESVKSDDETVKEIYLFRLEAAINKMKMEQQKFLDKVDDNQKDMEKFLTTLKYNSNIILENERKELEKSLNNYFFSIKNEQREK